MAQTQSPTTEGYTELAKLWAEEAATGAESVFCVGAAFTADATATYAGLYTDVAINGFGLANADTVATVTTTVANDTVQVDHVFTATGAGDVVHGFSVNNNNDDVCYASCLFNASLDLSTTGDTLTVQMKMQVKAG